MIKSLFSELKSMSWQCCLILKYGFAVSSLVLIAAIILFFTPGLFEHHHDYIHVLAELRSYPTVILLISAIAAVCAEDAVRRQ